MKETIVNNYMRMIMINYQNYQVINELEIVGLSIFRKSLIFISIGIAKLVVIVSHLNISRKLCLN
jgi:hypothetical protein